MSSRHRLRAQQWEVETSVKATYKIDLLEHIAQTLGKGGFSASLVK